MLRLDGSESPGPDGKPDDDFLLVINCGDEACHFALPDHSGSAAWHLVMDTARPAGLEILEAGSEEPLPAGTAGIEAHPRSVLLLTARPRAR